MGERITIAETVAWLKGRDSFLILTHRRPDGDTVGCAGALAQGLREIGKTAYVLMNPEITPRYARFVDDYWAPDGFTPEHVIAVDTASRTLFPQNIGDYADSISLTIDHHPSNSCYAELTCLTDAATCGETIYEILIELSGTISAKSADSLYAAVTTDTGCFVFANTTANSLRVAASLIDSGARHRALNKLLFRTKTRSRISIESLIYSGLEYHFDGAVAISTITKEMMESANATEDDVDDIAALPGSIEGVLAGITIRELSSPQDCKVSVRTSQSVDAHLISAHFGGGGHKLAAGFNMKKTVDEVKKELLEWLKEFFPPEAAANA